MMKEVGGGALYSTLLLVVYIIYVYIIYIL